MPTNDSDKPAVLKPAELTHAVIGVVSENGELQTDEIVRLVQEDEPEAGDQAIRRAITRLDRSGMLTRSNSDAPWQVTASGRNTMDAINSKRIAAFIAPYGRFTSVHAEYLLISPSLGAITEAAGKGKSHFERLDDGRIVLLGGCIRAAMQKALQRMDTIVSQDLNGAPKKIPDAAWERVTVYHTYLPADTRLVERIRRPVNKQGMAIGEIVHEALPTGAVLRVEAEFPLSHFPEPILKRLFRLTGAVGISPAGSGKGGLWGVAELLSLRIGDDDEEQTTKSEGERINGRTLLHA